MSEKVLVEIYRTYGKGDGEELSERYVIEDTPEEREGVLESLWYDESYDSREDFINGTTDVFDFDCHGGDWDDPTGGYIYIYTKEDAIKRSQAVAEREINEIEALFSRK